MQSQRWRPFSKISPWFLLQLHFQSSEVPGLSASAWEKAGPESALGWLEGEHWPMDRRRWGNWTSPALSSTCYMMTSSKFPKVIFLGQHHVLPSPSLYCSYWHVLDTEAHAVPRKGFTQSFMVHFNRLYFSCNTDWSKGDHHARFENTSLHLTHRDSTNTTNCVDVLEGQTQGIHWLAFWQVNLWEKGSSCLRGGCFRWGVPASLFNGIHIGHVFWPYLGCC